MVEVRPARLEDVEWIAPRLRDADRDEVLAAVGIAPEEALVEGFERSTKTFAGFYEEEPFIVFGVGTGQPDVGWPWLLGTDKIREARMGFLRQSEYWLNELHEGHPLLFNYVDARNTLHIRWLKWMGFSFINLHQEYGVGRLPFYEFVRII